MIDLGQLFDFNRVLQGTFGAKCPRPFAELADKAGLHGSGVSTVMDFERLWAHFMDDLLPIVGPGAAAIFSGDWSSMSQDKLTNMLQVWKVWTRYRDDLERAAGQLNPLAKGGPGIAPQVSQAAQAQLTGYNAFRKTIAVTEDREKKGAFARFKGWLGGKTTDLKQSLQGFNLDEWAETGWGQAATGVAGAAFVAMMSSTGDVEGYRAERQLPERERFRRWAEVESRYPGATRLERPAPSSTTKLGYGTVIGHVPDGRAVLETAVSLWVVDPNDL